MFRLLCFVAFSAIVGVFSQKTGIGKCPDVKIQDQLDINKYLGDWYEIFVFPTSFEKGKCIQATYTMKPDGHIQVYNQGFDNGTWVKAIGDAYRPDDNDPGKLLVRFAKGTPYGNYWVVHTDYTDYTMIYSCTSIGGLFHLEFAWILARNRTLDDTTAQMLKDELASYKVNINNFVKTDQSNCPDPPSSA